jgi:hypothetical protein
MVASQSTERSNLLFQRGVCNIREKEKAIEAQQRATSHSGNDESLVMEVPTRASKQQAASQDYHVVSILRATGFVEID